MIDIGFYLTVATIISTITGAVVALVTALIQGWVGKRQAILQEKQTDASLASINMSAATQLTGVSIQQTAQFYQILQDAQARIQDCTEREQRFILEEGKKDLCIQRAVASLEDLLQDCTEEYAKQGTKCEFYEFFQKDLQRIISILKSGTSCGD